MATTKNATTDNNKLWQQCLASVREQYGQRYQRWFDIWYADVKFDSYNPQTKQLRLQVPSKYVSAYLETAGAKSLRKAIKETFSDADTIGYIVAPSEPSFADVAAYLQRLSANGKHDIRQIRIPNAKQRMEDGLKYFLKGKTVAWLPKREDSEWYGYDRVVEWLTDNGGRGLLCVGTPGTGKSLICQKILPVLIGGGRPIVSVNASEMRDRLEELKKEPAVIIDDLGKEPRKHYGETDQSFFELCDNAERTGALLIITTNLSTTPVDDSRYPDSIQHRYGNEVLSRLQAITRVAIFEGNDLRNS